MRFHEKWLLAMAVVAAGVAVGARPAAAQDAAAGGPDFVDSQRLGAQVRGSDGALIRSIGASTAQRFGVGTYEVIFGRNLLSCAFKGSMGNLNFFAATGEIGLVGRAGEPNGIFVNTFDSSGTLADRDFFILVACP